MVTYQEFMEIGLQKCGSDPRTFREVAAIWSREKEQIRQMTKQQAMAQLNCP